MPSRAPTRRPQNRRTSLPVVGLLGIVALGAHAQTEPATPSNSGKRALSVETGLSVSETATDNVQLSSTNRQSDLITQISPYVSMRKNAGRLQGFFNYALTGILNARHSESNAVQQSLSASGEAEAIQDFAFVNASANISRQNISALGPQSPDPSLQTGNQTQVSTWTLNPYVRGHLGSSVSYLAGLTYSSTRTGTDKVGNSSNSGGNVHVGSDGALSKLNWAIDASRQNSAFTQGRRTVSDSAVASLVLTALPDLHLTVRGGEEVNDVLTVERESHPTYGAGLEWTPSARTTASLQGDKRYFGRSHAFKLEHRTALTAWTLVDSRDANTNASAGGQTAAQSQYDLIYLQLASKFPDPIDRANQALIALQNLGVNTAGISTNGFLSNAVTLQHTQSLSAAYLGLRTTVIVTAQKGETQLLDASFLTGQTPVEGTSTSQHGFSVSISHRLTPIASANLNLAQTRSTDTASGVHSDLSTITANWSSRVGSRTFLSLGARHSVSSGDTAGYTESAIFANLLLQF